MYVRVKGNKHRTLNDWFRLPSCNVLLYYILEVLTILSSAEYATISTATTLHQCVLAPEVSNIIRGLITLLS